MLEKGQIAFLDMFLVTSVFVVLFVFLSSNYSQKLTDLLADAKLEEMKFDAITATDFLALSKGYPAAWEKDLNVSTVGLASQPNELDSNKVRQFISLDYDTARRALGISKFNYFFQLNDSKNNQIFSSGLAPLSGVQVASVERIVIYEGNPSKIVLKVWG